MSLQMQVRQLWSNRLCTTRIALILLFSGIVGCAQVATQPVASLTPAPSPTTAIEVIVPAAWETYTSPDPCGYAISYPPDMQNGTAGWQHSWILRYSDLLLPPAGVAENYIYVSVLPEGGQTGGVGVIYNYDPAEAETLENMEIGESTTLRQNPDTAQEHTYTRLPDTVVGNQVTQAYETSKLSTGRKEIRYYFKDNGCAYLIGAYLNDADANQPGAIRDQLFDQIIATFHLTP